MTWPNSAGRDRWQPVALNDDEIKKGSHAEKLNQFHGFVALPKAAW